jgi:fimbrial chaperone protein
MTIRAIALAIALACLAATGVDAASLRVAPIKLDVAEGANSTTLKVWNTGDTTVRIQIRVYKWTHTGNDDVLTAQTLVAVSPPIATLKPGGENLIRIVRVGATPVTEREMYRVLVDQLPDPKGNRAGVVGILVRHAIPLYFEP